MNRIVITGSTGLIGRALTGFLRTLGYEVDHLLRPADWNPAAVAIHLDRLEGHDAVIHLAGANIASQRWTEARKREILDSRVEGTRLLADGLAAARRPPKLL